MAFVCFNAANLDAGEHRRFRSFFKVAADGDVLIDVGSVVFLRSVPFRTPVAVDTNAHANGINFMSHSFIATLLSSFPSR